MRARVRVYAPRVLWRGGAGQRDVAPPRPSFLPPRGLGDSPLLSSPAHPSLPQLFPPAQRRGISPCDVVIVSALRTPLCKAGRGGLKVSEGGGASKRRGGKFAL